MMPNCRVLLERLGSSKTAISHKKRREANCNSRARCTSISFSSDSVMASTSGNALEPTVLEHGKTEHTVHRETKDTDKGDLATVDTGYNESDIIADLPPAEGKKALWKVDIRLVPLLAVSGDEAYFHPAQSKLSKKLRCCTWLPSSTEVTCRSQGQVLP
jgi:hypothetical protein